MVGLVGAATGTFARTAARVRFLGGGLLRGGLLRRGLLLRLRDLSQGLDLQQESRAPPAVAVKRAEPEAGPSALLDLPKHLRQLVAQLRRVVAPGPTPGW